MRKILLSPAPLSRLAGQEVFLQNAFWGEFKAAFGWKPLSFLMSLVGSEDEGGGGTGPDAGNPQASADENTAGVEFPLLVLVRRLGRLGSIAYVPYPVFGGISPYHELPAARHHELTAVLHGLSRALAGQLPRDCLFVRWDLPWSFPESSLVPLPRKPFRPAPMDIQPPSTVAVDLSLDEAAILARMKPKTRYNIRLAEKKGVEVYEGGEEEIGPWYALYRETAERDRITLHPETYYRSLYRLVKSARSADPGGLTVDCRLLLARAEGVTVAGIFVLRAGRTATYLYGASSNEKRNYMPAYALQWKAMLLSKQDGCTVYDLFGIPPADDPAHPMHGLYRFKTGFGGTILHRPGCWDYPLHPAAYGLYRAAEGLRNLYYRNIRKRNIREAQGREAGRGEGRSESSTAALTRDTITREETERAP